MAAMTYKDFVKDALTRVPEATCEEVRRSIDNKDKSVVLDIREGDETANGVLPGAVRTLVPSETHPEPA